MHFCRSNILLNWLMFLSILYAPLFSYQLLAGSGRETRLRVKRLNELDHVDLKGYQRKEGMDQCWEFWKICEFLSLRFPFRLGQYIYPFTFFFVYYRMMIFDCKTDDRYYYYKQRVD
uniref:(northern house mosquito) hypothetical protein n=1 Tax=Culex pipiens TaxID=7175 RepID=A0A8D8CK62_CULPI